MKLNAMIGPKVANGVQASTEAAKDIEAEGRDYATAKAVIDGLVPDGWQLLWVREAA